jgi:hypothetical protein
MEEAASGVPDLAGSALRRANLALAVLKNWDVFDVASAERQLSEMITSHTRRSESV